MSRAKMEVKRKKIVILSRGPIGPKGGAYGPVLTPYNEDIQTIQTLVTHNYHVEEVISGNQRVRLTLENVNTDNDPSLKEAADKAAKEAEAKAKAEQEAAEKEAKEAEEKAAREAAEKAKRDAQANKKLEDTVTKK